MANGLPKLEIKKIKRTIIEFVKNYTEFVQTYGSEPRRCGTKPNEVELYKQKWRFTQKKYLKPEDAEYLIEKGFELFDDIEKVRKTIIKFVSDYNEFVQTYGDDPKYSNTRPGELELYRKKRRLTQIKNITPEE